MKVGEERCVVADYRMTSVPQQSNQLLSLGEKIASSPSTIFRQHEKVRIKTMQVEEQPKKIKPNLLTANIFPVNCAPNCNEQFRFAISDMYLKSTEVIQSKIYPGCIINLVEI